MKHVLYLMPVTLLCRLFSGARPAAAPSRVVPEPRLFAPLLECLPTAPPPPGLLERIEEKIDGQRRARQHRLPRLRLAGAGLLGAAAGVMAMLLLALLPERKAPEVPVPLTVIEGTERVAMLGARTLADGQYLRIDHFGLNAPENLALELWLISDGSGRPESLGLLSARSGATVLPLVHAIAAGDLLAVSAEPMGGAPGSGPSGPVIITARVGSKS